jgi:hypothetical protein
MFLYLNLPTDATSMDIVRFEIDNGNPGRGDATTATLQVPEAPDLSGLVSKLHRRPVFTGPYSKVYVGRYGHQKVFPRPILRGSIL